MVQPCVWSQEGSSYPQLLSLVHSGDFERLASTLGKLHKSAKGPHHIRSLQSDLQCGIGVQIPDQTVRNRLYSSRIGEFNVDAPLVDVWQDINLGTIRRLIRNMPGVVKRAFRHVEGSYPLSMCLLIWLNEWSQFWDNSISRSSLCFSTWFRESPNKWLFPIRLGQFCSVFL